MQVTNIPIFRKGGLKHKSSGSFSFDWNGYDNWNLYLITKEEVEKLNRELIVLNL